MARRKDDDWYVAALNCREEQQSVEIDLTGFELNDRTMMVYREGASRESCQIETSSPIPQDKRIKVSLPSGGGYLARIRIPREYTEWRD